MNEFPLYCPISKLALVPADEVFMERFHLWASKSELTYRSGAPVSGDLTALLIETKSNIAYPVRLGIPQLLPQLAISLAGLNSGNSFD